MSIKDELHRLVDEMPEEEAHRLVAFLRSEAKPEKGLSLQEAIDYTFEHFDDALRRLAQ